MAATETPLWPYTWGRAFRALSLPFDLLYRVTVTRTIVLGGEQLTRLPARVIFAGTHHSYADLPLFRRALAKTGARHLAARLAIATAADGFANEDKMGLHLANLIKDRIGDIFLPYVHPHFEDDGGQRVLVVRCERGPKAAFVKDGNNQRFFVRGGNTTVELTGISVTDYAKQRFGG